MVATEVYVVGEGSDIFRMSLEGGQFMSPLVSSSPSLNCIDVAMTTQLIVTGGEDGVVEVWDPRTRTTAAKVDVPGAFTEGQFPVSVLGSFAQGVVWLGRIQ